MRDPVAAPNTTKVEADRDHRLHDALRQRAAQSATSRTGRSLRRPEGSFSLPHQVVEEDVLELALGRAQVAEADARRIEIVEQRRDAGALALGSSL